MVAELIKRREEVSDVIATINKIAEEYPIHKDFILMQNELNPREGLELIRTKKHPYVVQQFKHTEHVLKEHREMFFSFLYGNKISGLEKELDDFKTLRGLFSRLANALNYLEKNGVVK